MRILGSHNSATSYKLVGWQRWFAPLINLFTRCQTKTLEEQFNDGIRLFDIQVNLKDDRWLASHGIAWYDVEPLKVLNELSLKYNEKIYVYLGFDRHYLHPYRIDKFHTMRSEVEVGCPNLELKKIYIETPYYSMHIYDDTAFTKNVKEVYWTMTWARNMKNGKWWKFFYYLPIPKLWKKLYHKEWDAQGEGMNYMTDFV